jgi:phospholipase/carboxylesterase
VWLHGLGADGHDFEPVVPRLRLPGVRFVFPHAPARPVTINGGFVMPAWYDILSLERREDREDARDIAVSAGQIEALLRREVERGVPSSRVVLAGFSQGAAMALHVGIGFDQPLAALVCLSGYQVLASTMAAHWRQDNRTTPILCCHGVYDDVVPVDLGRQAYDFVRTESRSTQVQWREYPIAHEVSPAEIDAVGDWLRERLA